MYYNPHETPKSIIRRRFDILERGGKGGRLIFALGDDQSILVVGPGQGGCFPLISYARMGGSLEDCWYGGTWGPHTHRGSHTHTRGRSHTHGDGHIHTGTATHTRGRHTRGRHGWGQGIWGPHTYAHTYLRRTWVLDTWITGGGSWACSGEVSLYGPGRGFYPALRRACFP